MARPIKIRGWYHLRFFDRTRRPNRKSVALRTQKKKQAEDFAADLQRRWLLGEYDPWTDSPFLQRKGADSLVDATEAFLESRSDLRPASLRSYRLMVRQLLGEVPGQMSVRDLSEAYLKAYFNAPSLSPATRRHRYRHTRVLMNWLVDQGFVEESPMRRIAPPKAKPSAPAYLTAADYTRLVAHLDRQDRSDLADVIVFAVCTGARLGELCAARVDSIRRSREGLVFAIVNTDRFQTKNGEDRFVAVEHDAVDVAERRTHGRTSSAPLFTTRRGAAWRPTYLSKQFKAAVRALGLDERLHFHSLRHTSGSLMSAGGASLLTTKATLGHSDTRMSEHYAQMPQQAVRREARAALQTALPSRGVLSCEEPRAKKDTPRRRVNIPTVSRRSKAVE